jgi:hypothetical protein
MKTPSVVLDAFFPATITVAGLVLKHRFTVKHWLALEKIESPFVSAGAAVKMLDAVRALYIISLAPADVFVRVSGDREAFETEAVELAGRIPLAELAGIVKAIYRHMNAGFVTAPPGNEDEGGDGEDAGPLSRNSAQKVRDGSSRSSPRSAKKRSTSTRQ